MRDEVAEAGVLAGRKDHCLAFLDKVRLTIAGKSAVTDQSDLCVYTAGSYGRLEAWPSSDLDLFIVHDDSSGDPLPLLTSIRVQAALVDCFDELHLQPPSNDGEFLKIHWRVSLIG